MAEEPRHAESKFGRSWLKIEPLSYAHLAQVGLALVLTFSAIKVMIVVNGNAALAATVLRSSGYIAPVVASSLGLLPIILIIVFTNTLLYHHDAKEGRGKDFVARNWFIIMAWTGLAMLFITPWPLALFTFVGAGFLQWNDKRLRGKERATGRQVTYAEYMNIRRREIILPVGISMVSLLFMSLVTGGIWLPREAIKTNEGTVRGYVLTVAADVTTVLRETTRTPIYIPTGEVEDRLYCDDRSWFVPAFELGRDRPPSCPDESGSYVDG